MTYGIDMSGWERSAFGTNEQALFIQLDGVDKPTRLMSYTMKPQTKMKLTNCSGRDRRRPRLNYFVVEIRNKLSKVRYNK